MSTEHGEQHFLQLYLKWRLDQGTSDSIFVDSVKTQNREAELWQIFTQLPSKVALKIGKRLVKEQPNWASKVVDLQVRQLLSLAWKLHSELEIEQVLESLRTLTLDFPTKYILQATLDTLTSYVVQLKSHGVNNTSSNNDDASELRSVVNFHTYACVIPVITSPTNTMGSSAYNLSRDRILQRIAISARETNSCSCQIENCQNIFLDVLINAMLPLVESFLCKVREEAETTHEYTEQQRRFITALRYMGNAAQSYDWKCQDQLKHLIGKNDTDSRPVHHRKLANILNDRLKKDRDTCNPIGNENHHTSITQTTKREQQGSSFPILLSSPNQNDSLSMSIQKTKIHHELTLCKSCSELEQLEEFISRRLVKNKGMQYYSLLRMRVEEWVNQKLEKYYFSEIYSSGLLGYAYSKFWHAVHENNDDLIRTYYQRHYLPFLEILKPLSIERKCVFVRFAFQQRSACLLESANAPDSSDIRTLSEELTTIFNQITSGDETEVCSIDESFIDTLLNYSFFSPRLLFSKLLRVVIKNKGCTEFVSTIFRNLQGLTSLRTNPDSPSLLIMEIKSALGESAVKQLTGNERCNAIAFLVEALKTKSDHVSPSSKPILDISEYISYCAVPILANTVVTASNRPLFEVHLEAIAKVLEFQTNETNTPWWLTRTKSLSFLSVMSRLLGSRSQISSVHCIQNIKRSLNILIDLILQTSVIRYGSNLQKLYSTTAKLDWTTQLFLHRFFRTLSLRDCLTLVPLPLPSTFELLFKEAPSLDQFYFFGYNPGSPTETSVTQPNGVYYKKHLLLLFGMLDACRISDDWLLYFVKYMNPVTMEIDRDIFNKSLLLGMVYTLSSSTLDEHQRLCYLLPQQLITNRSLIPEKILQHIAPLIQGISSQGLSNLAVIAWNMQILYWVNRVATLDKEQRVSFDSYHFISLTLKDVITSFLHDQKFLLSAMVLLCQGLQYIPTEYKSEPTFILITQLVESHSSLPGRTLTQEQRDHLYTAISLIPHDSQKQVLLLKINQLTVE